MFEELNTSDWEEAFKYATPHLCEAGHDHSPTATIVSSVSTQGYTRDDVINIIAIREGENDGANWLGVFYLKDGRYAVLRAGCDYTGWG